MDEMKRGSRKTAVGVVTRAKMNKTRRVEIGRLVAHPQYGKYQKRRTVCYAHDEANHSQMGDLVEIMETRPLSKTKRWRLVRVVRRGEGGTGESAVEPSVEEHEIMGEVPASGEPGGDV